MAANMKGSEENRKAIYSHLSGAAATTKL